MLDRAAPEAKQQPAATRPVDIFAGAADELMVSDKYRDAAGPHATVRIIEGVDHMGIVSNPAAVGAIAEAVAQAGPVS